ncbi:MAG: hypothetical protein AAFN51_13690, partial [Pseudomonadota bacterium]
MTGLIPFPDISPELFSISIFGFELALRWYALAYIVGILLGWRMVVAALKTPRLWPNERAPMTGHAALPNHQDLARVLEIVGRFVE